MDFLSRPNIPPHFKAIPQKPTNVLFISRNIHDVWREQSNAAVKSGRILTIIHVTSLTFVSSKSNVGQGKSYELSAIHE